MHALLAGLGFILIIAFGIFQIVMGYLGIEYNLGMGWAIAAIAASLFFRFSLPITIGTYFGIVDVLGWHWSLGVMIAAPSLLLMVPSLVLSITDSIGSMFSNTKDADIPEIDASTTVEEISPTEIKISPTVKALADLRLEYENEGEPYNSCINTAFQQAEFTIRRNENKAKGDIIKTNRESVETALKALSHVSESQITIGGNHEDKGVLTDRGKGFLFVFYKTVYLLLEKGFINEPEAQDDVKTIQSAIKAAG